MDAMAAETGETVQLCGLRGNKYVVLDCRDSPGPFRISSDVGVEVPIPWTASGRLLLGHMSDDEVRAFVPADDYRLPDGRIIAPEAISSPTSPRRGGRVSAKPPALADRFTWCMAAPIRDGHGAITRRCASSCRSTRRKPGAVNCCPCCASAPAASRWLAASSIRPIGIGAAVCLSHPASCSLFPPSLRFLHSTKKKR